MSENPLPGNPFTTEDALYTEDANNASVVNATLALAYEQRTANLLAVLHGPSTVDVNYAEIKQQIIERLEL